MKTQNSKQWLFKSKNTLHLEMNAINQENSLINPKKYDIFET